ncbi:MAG: glycosyl hydrolase [Cyclobacteriaceae bacterium]
MKIKMLLMLLAVGLMFSTADAQRRGKSTAAPTVDYDTALYNKMKWRNIGPFRGGRSTTSTGVVGNPYTYYMGTAGGGVWKTEDAGLNWKNVSDGFFQTGSVGAVAVAESDPNVVYVGMGEAPIRGVMTTSGDGVYRSTDEGKTWEHLGLEKTLHISQVRIHPDNPDVAFVSAMGSPYNPTPERGVYRTKDGGESWEKVLFIDNTTGAVDLTMDMTNPRILYAAMWDYQRLPWYARSGGPGSGIWKSTDGGDTWNELTEGLPKAMMGKIGVSVSRANPDRVFAVIESDEGGLYRSDDAGKSWKLLNSDRIIRTRSWYYMHIFADPVDENKVYIMNAPFNKSIDGGKTFTQVRVPHGDNHYLWINPDDPNNMINSNDGGSNITFNGGKSWTDQKNQPTAQFYRVTADNRFPYWVYGGQQDNSSVATPSRTFSNGISWKDWISGVGGCESSYVAFDPNNPNLMYAGCYQGIIQEYNLEVDRVKDIKAYPENGLGEPSSEQKYRFNWNAPILVSQHNSDVIYHAAQMLLRSTDRGITWEEVSPELTGSDTTKLGPGGGPITNEGAGSEIYQTIYYVSESMHTPDVIYTGSDDGLVYITRDGGDNWTNITPPGIGEGMINAIDISSHDPATAYVAFTRYKFGDFAPYAYKTTDYGQTWKKITNGIEDMAWVRVIREDPMKKDLLYAGTERGLFVSFDGGNQWKRWQSNLPMTPITDLKVHQNDLLASTQGRAFWILDDLTPLHQLSIEVANSEAYLYQPRDVVAAQRSAMRRQPPMGENPYPGAEIKYYLKEVAEEDTIPVTFEIMDDRGEVIRSFSSDADKKWAKAAKETGMNVLEWNLRIENFDPAEGVMASRGGNGMTGYKVTPGDFKVKMTYGDISMEQSFSVLPDPREPVTANQYAQKRQMLETLKAEIDAIYNNLTQMQQVRGQIKGLNERFGDDESMQDVTEKGKEIQKSIGGVENRLISPKQETFQDVINFRNQLDNQIYYLMETIDDNIPPLTNGEQVRYDDLHKVWMDIKVDADQILQKDVPALNQLIKEKDTPFIAPKEKEEEKVGS